MSHSAIETPHFRKLTIVAQDPSVTVAGRILTADVDVPSEELLPGPCGYRVNVIDFDASANLLYEPADIDSQAAAPWGQAINGARAFSNQLLQDPRAHARHVYAIVMRTLTRFEFALGRRMPWGFDGHQIHVAPHAFAGANAFYSREGRGLFFGYFKGVNGKTVYTCLSHDVVAHETTHAIIDGLRRRYMEPSSADQAAFHEGFSDIVALLSVFSIRDVVSIILGDARRSARTIRKAAVTRPALKKSILFHLAKEVGQEIQEMRGSALRHSIELVRGKPYMAMPEFEEPHRRGELLVAAVMNAFIDIWIKRIGRLGFVQKNRLDRAAVVEEGARAADHLLTIAIRSIDYCPPTDIAFSDYLSALLTVDSEVVPDDTYRYREVLLKNFADFGIKPIVGSNIDGTLKRCGQSLVYARTHFDSMLRDKEEVFRFIWENRDSLCLGKHGYIEVQSVRPCTRVGPDGFVLRETVVEYVQILTLTLQELRSQFGIDPQIALENWRRIRIYGGGALIFDEYGQVKYQIAHHLANSDADIQRQCSRLESLWKNGYFDRGDDAAMDFAELHLMRALK